MVRLEAGAGVAPAEFRIFPFGQVQTEHGVYWFTPEDAQRVLDAWRRRGVQVPIDYDHEMVSGGKPPFPAAGWADLQVRPDGLWAVNVQWTDRAREMLEAREYRYISPAFQTETRDRREHIVDLVNVALTNLPATHHLEPLVARAVPWRGGRVVDGEWDADAAEQRVRRWASSDGSGDKDTIDWSKYAMAHGWYDAENPENFGSYKLIHHDVMDGELVVHKSGVHAAAAVLQGARGGVDIPEADLPAVRRHIARHYHQWDEKAPWEREESREGTMDEIVAVLGAQDAQGAVAAARRLLALREAVLGLTGAETDSQALGVLHAWQQAHKQLAAAQERIAELEAKLRDREVEDLVQAAARDGKLTPAMLDWARRLGRSDIEMLRAYVEAAPRIIALSAQLPHEPAVDVTPERFSKMTYRERAELFQRDPELYRKLRDAAQTTQ